MLLSSTKTLYPYVRMMARVLNKFSKYSIMILFFFGGWMVHRVTSTDGWMIILKSRKLWSVGVAAGQYWAFPHFQHIQIRVCFRRLFAFARQPLLVFYDSRPQTHRISEIETTLSPEGHIASWVIKMIYTFSLPSWKWVCRVQDVFGGGKRTNCPQWAIWKIFCDKSHSTRLASPEIVSELIRVLIDW